jgi:hypothetical protein
VKSAENRRLTVSRNGCCLGFVRQPETGQRHSREADAEFLKRRAARDGLGHAFGQFIEFVVHDFSFLSSGDLHLRCG